MEQLTKNQAVATSQEAVQNQNEPQLRDENAHNDKSVHGVLNPTYQAGLRRDAVQPDIEAERKKRDEIEAGKSYCSRRFGGATCDDKSAQIYARFDKNDWRIQPAEFYRFHDAEVNTFDSSEISESVNFCVMEAIKLCRLDTPIIFIEARINLTTNLLKFMRASIKMIGVSNLQSFIASMTQKLTLSDISDESKNYLDKAGITTACLRIKSKWTAGGK